MSWWGWIIAGAILLGAELSFVSAQFYLVFIGSAAILVGLATLLLPLAPFADQKTMDLAVLILTYVMLGWGLNIVVGLAGLLDLGYVAFYAVGAYTCALLSTQAGWASWSM